MLVYEVDMLLTKLPRPVRLNCARPVNATYLGFADSFLLDLLLLNIAGLE